MEEVEIGDTTINFKEFEINESENKYKCQIQIIKKFLCISLYNENKLKNKGYIHISNIQYSLGIYNFEINDIFDEINKLNNDKFKIIKDINKYQLKIEFKIINKKRYIYIDLNENENINNENEYIKEIKELKEIIKMKDNKIKLLEEELNKNKSYNNFNIELEPKYILNYHKDWIWCSTVLKDGRAVTGSGDNSIIIYNKETFKPDLIIKEHIKSVICIIELTSGELASCSSDNTIKIYNINGNEYRVKQILSEHDDRVNKIIELKNKKLVSCSKDKSIIFFNKINNEYKKEYSFTTKLKNGPIIQTKDNEICFHEYEEEIHHICFFDINKNEIINEMINISISSCSTDCLLMISKDLLLIGGNNIMSLVNVNTHKLIKIINVPDSGNIYAVCILNKNIIITGDYNKRIIKWIFEDDNLKLIAKKENAHDHIIFTLSRIGNNSFLSGSYDNLVKIWC